MNDNSSDPVAAFEKEAMDSIATYRDEANWLALSRSWMTDAFLKRYMYNFTAMGRPIIQLPTDMVAVQEIIWSVKPDLIIETGIAHGGSLIMSAAMLALVDYCEAVETKSSLDLERPRRRVLGIDIDIRAHNREAIERHPLSNRIDLLQGSSVSAQMIDQVRSIASGFERVLVCLDSNHVHDHVLAELEAYAPLTSHGSYCIVFDTIVEDLPVDFFADRPWNVGNSPKTAVRHYLDLLERDGRKASDGADLRFVRDRQIEDKLLLTVAPEGYLRRV